MTEYRVGQRVRVEDVQEGIVTGVDDGVIYVSGNARMTDGSPYDMTRTITILSEPKPDEPKLLGAVVRDGDSMVWALAEPGRAPWRRLGPEWVWRAWADVDAVEVLFPGVES